MTNEEYVKESINLIERLGFKARIENISLQTSFYVKISDNNDNPLFVIRFSDHYLNIGNYLPAGVIMNSFESNSEIITKEDFYWHLSFYEKFIKNDKEEIEELWTNRYINE